MGANSVIVLGMNGIVWKETCRVLRFVMMSQCSSSSAACLAGAYAAAVAVVVGVVVVRGDANALLTVPETLHSANTIANNTILAFSK